MLGEKEPRDLHVRLVRHDGRRANKHAVHRPACMTSCRTSTRPRTWQRRVDAGLEAVLLRAKVVAVDGDVEAAEQRLPALLAVLRGISQ